MDFLNLSEKNYFKIGLFLLWFSVLLALYSLSNFPKQISAALYYRQLASKLPPSTIRHKRLMAISEALLRGKTTYQFKAGMLPPITGAR